MSQAHSVPTEHDEPVNSRILAVSEDQIQGFHPRPFHAIADQSGVDLETVLARIRAMVAAGVVRRVRQTLLANKLAEGALVAWRVPEDRIEAAFDFMAKEDPFSGHVVLRSTDREISGSSYKLWTTLKVPQGQSLDHHAGVLKKITGAEEYILMPAKGIFALGVGHVRRQKIEPGMRAEQPARMMQVSPAELDDREWRVLLALKGELTPGEIVPEPWNGRAASIGMDVDAFCEVARSLDRKRVIGRFSTFLEHVKPSSEGKRVTRFNGLFHWKVPEGMQERAGGEVGRHPIMTHCYWREGGPAFGNVNIMGVVHGTDRDLVFEHKAAIDRNLEAEGIPVEYTNVFWGGRSEIKPSEISPVVYREWHAKFDTAR